MKEKIIQGGIVNGVKMLVCPTWEEDFQTEIHKTGGCLRISMNYSAVDVSPFWRIQECLYILFLILSHANYFCQIMTYNKILSSIFLIYISNLCFNSLYIKISTSVSTQ